MLGGAEVTSHCKRARGAGDVRNCLVALSRGDELMTRLMDYRFVGDGSLGGVSMGNLLLASLTSIVGASPRARGVPHARARGWGASLTPARRAAAVLQAVLTARWPRRAESSTFAVACYHPRSQTQCVFSQWRLCASLTRHARAAPVCRPGGWLHRRLGSRGAGHRQGAHCAAPHAARRIGIRGCHGGCATTRARAPTCVLVRVRELAGLSCCVGTYVYPCTGTYS